MLKPPTRYIGIEIPFDDPSRLTQISASRWQDAAGTASSATGWKKGGFTVKNGDLNMVSG